MIRLGAHAPAKYSTGTLIGTSRHRGWNRLLVERRANSEGDLGEVEVRDTEVIVMIRGDLRIRRRGDGKLEHCHATPGTIWLCPDGVREDMMRLYGDVRESVHLFLPASPLSKTALEEIGVDPDKVRLRYEGGFHDPLIERIAWAIRAEMLDPAPAGKMLVETLSAALGVHILRHYSNLAPASVPPPAARGALDPGRLRRVVDFMETHLADDPAIGRLADEARLFPLYFDRLLKRPVGTAPGEYRGYGVYRSDTLRTVAERHGDVTFLALHGRLDAATAETFMQAVRDAAGETGRALILDLKGLAYLGSAGLRAILFATQDLESRDTKLALCALPAPVRKMFRVTGFGRFLPIHDTPADALASLECGEDASVSD